MTIIIIVPITKIMLIILASLNNNFALILIIACIIIVVFSVKGNISPLITIISFALIGFLFFQFGHNSTNSNEDLAHKIVPLKTNIVPEKVSSKQDVTSPSVSDYSQKEEYVNQKKSISKKEIISQKPDELPIEKSIITEENIPSEYDVTDRKLWTYKVKSTLKLDKSFMDFFEKTTGLRKEKNGNYDITINYNNGNFSKKDGEMEREFIYSGGEIQVKINGKTCCCSEIVSVPAFSCKGNLNKAKSKLKEKVNQLFMENKEGITKKIQQCL